MTSPESVSALIERLDALKAKLIDEDENAQKEALMLSRMLTFTLNEPVNTAVEQAFSPFISMSAKIAVDLKLFEYLVAKNSPITAAELATLSGAEELLIMRVLRPLSALGFLKEVGAQTWTPTPVSRAMAIKEIAAGHRMLFDLPLQGAWKAPKFFKETGYKCPENPKDGLVQYAFQTKLQAFQFLASKPELLNDFNSFMGNTMGARNYWIDWYPVQKRILDGAFLDTPLIVDVGGGKGHDLIEFNAKYPGHKLILQDLQPVIDSISDLSKTAELMTYDFFTDQPLKDARVYFFHHILHDWSDSKCFEILASVKSAMKPGYSLLLLHEMIIPEIGASVFHAMLDLTMMAFNSGMERTEKQFTELLNKAGFEVVKIWLPEGHNDADGIVEAMVKI